MTAAIAERVKLCAVARWRRTLRQYRGGRYVVRALLPKSNAGIALRISLAGSAAMLITSAMS